ncbi:outer membrane biogenesis protein BamB [Planctomycetes bacterium Pan216]|uniref:Outer membrane biogenesis protein BamB n=1 Tax=Kolteria novifilia TaxID=2527975 RepID=A0A518B2Y8_9BACT|nr:outer membrane biogenesis protein BamB [Planctomycetes bacterium Pan216]
MTLGNLIPGHGRAFGLAIMVTWLAWTSTRAAHAESESWPRFRGPNGTATSSSDSMPSEIGPSNVLWKAKLGGLGHSSPVVAGNRVFLTSAEDEGRVRLIQCFDVTTGKLLWRAQFPFATHKKHKQNTYATATPVTDGELVFFEFTDPEDHVVYCYTVDGQEIWKRSLGAFDAGHGSGSSPILHKDKLIIFNDDDSNSYIIALDKETGKPVWKETWASEKAAYSTPFVMNVDGKDQLIFSSIGGIEGRDADTGKQVWVCDRFDMRTVGSPVLADGLIVATCGSGNSGKNMVAVRPDGKGDVSETHVAWESSRSLPYCVTPVAHGPHLFMVTDQGLARCVVAKTGEEVWTKRMNLGGRVFSSPLLLGDRLFIFGEQGDVKVIAAESAYRPIADSNLEDHFLSTPAVANGKMFVRGEDFLWCLGDPSTKAAKAPPKS